MGEPKLNLEESGEIREIEMDFVKSISPEEDLSLDQEMTGVKVMLSHNLPHPMCIPDIVDNILSYLNISDLKSCRLVNSQYNEVACRNLARKEVISFNKITHLSSYLSCMPISSPLLSSLVGPEAMVTTITTPTNNSITTTPTDNKKNTLLEYLNSAVFLQDNNKNIHYAHTSYHFNFDPDCTQEGDEGYETLQEFFATLGPHIRSLHYTTDLIPFNFPKRLPHIGDIWKNRMDNLETLSLEMKWGIPSVLFENEEGQVTLPLVRRLNLDILVTEREADRAATFLRQMLQAMPNLEEITIPGNKRFFDDYINVVLIRIILTLELPRLSKLQFCLALNVSQIQALAAKNLPLKSLILDFADTEHLPLPLPHPQVPGPALPGNNDENNNQNNNVPIVPHNNINHHQELFNNQILNRSLQALFLQTAPTLEDLHLCFPYNPAHPLHGFNFEEPMMKLSYIALGGFYGSVEILEQLPAVGKIDLWHVRFHDFDYGDASTGTIGAPTACSSNDMDSSNSSVREGNDEGKQIRFVPEKYLGITTVIS